MAVSLDEIDALIADNQHLLAPAQPDQATAPEPTSSIKSKSIDDMINQYVADLAKDQTYDPISAAAKAQTEGDDQSNELAYKVFRHQNEFPEPFSMAKAGRAVGGAFTGLAGAVKGAGGMAQNAKELAQDYGKDIWNTAAAHFGDPKPNLDAMDATDADEQRRASELMAAGQLGVKSFVDLGQGVARNAVNLKNWVTRGKLSNDELRNRFNDMTASAAAGQNILENPKFPTGETGVGPTAGAAQDFPITGQETPEQLKGIQEARAKGVSQATQDITDQANAAGFGLIGPGLEAAGPLMSKAGGAALRVAGGATGLVGKAASRTGHLGTAYGLFTHDPMAVVGSLAAKYGAPAASDLLTDAGNMAFGVPIRGGVARQIAGKTLSSAATGGVMGTAFSMGADSPEQAIGDIIGGIATAPIYMLDNINAGKSRGQVMTNRAEVQAALDNRNQRYGELIKYGQNPSNPDGTPVDRADGHDDGMAMLPKEEQDRINLMQGVLAGRKNANGDQVTVNVLPADQYGQLAGTRSSNGELTRGFVGQDGNIYLNAEGSGPGGIDRTGRHEFGHVADRLSEIVGSDFSQHLADSIQNKLYDNHGRPVPEFQRFIRGYQNALGGRVDMPTAQQEFIAETVSKILEGKNIEDFSKAPSIGELVRQGASDAMKSLGLAPKAQDGVFSWTEIPQITRQFRSVLREVAKGSIDRAKAANEAGSRYVPPKGSEAPTGAAQEAPGAPQKPSDRLKAAGIDPAEVEAMKKRAADDAEAQVLRARGRRQVGADTDRQQRQDARDSAAANIDSQVNDLVSNLNGGKLEHSLHDALLIHGINDDQGGYKGWIDRNGEQKPAAPAKPATENPDLVVEEAHADEPAPGDFGISERQRQILKEKGWSERAIDDMPLHQVEDLTHEEPVQAAARDLSNLKINENKTQDIQGIGNAGVAVHEKPGLPDVSASPGDTGVSQADQVEEAMAKHAAGTPIGDAVRVMHAGREVFPSPGNPGKPGKVLLVKGYESAKKGSEGSFGERERSEEVKAQSAEARKAGAKGTLQDKPFIVNKIKMNAKGEPYAEGFDVGVMTGNLRSLVDMMRDNGVDNPFEKTRTKADGSEEKYLDHSAIGDALETYLWNQNHGFDGAGLRRLDNPNKGLGSRLPEPSQDANPVPLDANPATAQRMADLFNMAINAKAEDIGGAAASRATALHIANKGLPPGGEVNALRSELNAKGLGDELDAMLHKRNAFNGRLSPELVRKGVVPNGDQGEGNSVRPHGFDIDLNKAFQHGKPQFEAVAAGFMPSSKDTSSIKSKSTKDEPALGNFMPSGNKGGETITGPERDKNFQKWTSGAPIFHMGDSLDDVSTGKPVVIEGIHGTTHDFESADPGKGNLESDFGKGFYVTTSPEDAHHNYAGEGPDLTNRIETASDKLESEVNHYDFTDEAVKVLVDKYKVSEDTAQRAAAGDPKAIREIAASSLKGHEGASMKVFVKMENPIKLGGDGEHRWSTGYDEETGEETGEIPEFINAVRDAAEYYNGDLDEDRLSGLLDMDGSLANKVILEAKHTVAYHRDPVTGEMASGEIVREALQRMGYDGIIDARVGKKFSAMRGVHENMAHVIAFRPEQIKSATGNRGTFDPALENMNFMPNSNAHEDALKKAQGIEKEISDLSVQKRAAKFLSPEWSELNHRIAALAKEGEIAWRDQASAFHASLAQKKYEKSIIEDPKKLAEDHQNAQGIPVLNGDAIIGKSPAMRNATPEDAVSIAKDIYPIAKQARDKAYDYLLSQPKQRNGQVLIMAGGPGSGKSTVAKAMGEPDLIYDTNLGDKKLAERQIRAALESGRPVKVVLVDRDAEEAMLANLERFDAEKRVATADTVATNNVGAKQNVKALAEEFKGNPDVSFEVRRVKSGTAPKEVSLESVKDQSVDEALKKVHTALDEIDNGTHPEWTKPRPSQEVIDTARGFKKGARIDEQGPGSSVQAHRGEVAGGQAQGPKSTSGDVGALGNFMPSSGYAETDETGGGVKRKDGMYQVLNHHGVPFGEYGTKEKAQEALDRIPPGKSLDQLRAEKSANPKTDDPTIDRRTGRSTLIPGGKLTAEQSTAAAEALRESYRRYDEAHRKAASSDEDADFEQASKAIPEVTLKALGLKLDSHSESGIVVADPNNDTLRYAGRGGESVTFVDGNVAYKVFHPQYDFETRQMGGVGITGDIVKKTRGVDAGKWHVAYNAGTVGDVLEKLNALAQVGGIPSEIVGKTPSGALVVKQPVYPPAKAMGNKAQATKDAYGKMAIEPINNEAKDSGLLDHTFEGVGVVDGVPYSFADLTGSNHIQDNQGEVRLSDPVIGRIPQEILDEVPSLNKQVKRMTAEEPRDRFSRQFMPSGGQDSPEAKRISEINKEIPTLNWKDHEDQLSALLNERNGLEAALRKQEDNAKAKAGQESGGEDAVPANAPANAPKGAIPYAHWSNAEGITEIDPARYGSGGAGAERARAKLNPDRFVKRSYLGVGDYQKEPYTGKNKYTGSVDPELIYDAAKDPDDLSGLAIKSVEQNPDLNRTTEFERLIKEHGYLGYRSGNVVAVFHKIPTDAHTGPQEFAQSAPEYARRSPEMMRLLKDQVPLFDQIEERYFQPKPADGEQVAKQNGIAKAYEDAKLDNLSDPKVRRAYDALATKINDQYDKVLKGVDVEPWADKQKNGAWKGREGQPYKNSAEIQEDIRQNKHLYFFTTTPESFGSNGKYSEDHPMLQDSGRTTRDGYPLLNNDILRAVHDAIAHGAFGAQFGPAGEELAWKAHMATIDDPWARWALTTETRGQNSWVNSRDALVKVVGTLKKKGDKGYVPPQDRPFADQKTDLLDPKYMLTGDRAVDQVVTNDPEFRKAAGLPDTMRDNGGKYMPTSGPEEQTAEGPEGTSWIQKPSRTMAGDVLVNVKVPEFDKGWSKDGDYIPEGGGGAEIKGRIPAFKEWLKKGEQIIAPEVTVNDDGSVYFTNGRHRYSYFRDKGADTIPVTMEPQSAEKAKELGMLSDESKSFMPSSDKAPPDEDLPDGLTLSKKDGGWVATYKGGMLSERAFPSRDDAWKDVSEPGEARYPQDARNAIREGRDPGEFKLKSTLEQAMDAESRKFKGLQNFMPSNKAKVGDEGALRELDFGKRFTPEAMRQQSIKERSADVKQEYPEALPPVYKKGEDGKFKFDQNDRPQAEKVPYNLDQTPLAKQAMKGIRGHQARTQAAATAYADKLTEEFDRVKYNPEIMAGQDWYKLARTKIKDHFGDDSLLFSQLLGATSARTPVGENFKQALDAYNQLQGGAYEGHAEKYLDLEKKLESGEDLRFPETYSKDVNNKKTVIEAGTPVTKSNFKFFLDQQGVLPKQSNNKEFNANSLQVLRVLAGNWEAKLTGPKTPNFARNLSGEGNDPFQATIDVWAARNLHRLGNEGLTDKRWRILPQAESGVDDNDFGLAQSAYKEAAARLGMNPDALQAVLWFAEKQAWKDRGWTRGTGAELSDFNTLLDKVETRNGRKVIAREPDPQQGFNFMPSTGKGVDASAGIGDAGIMTAHEKLVDSWKGVQDWKDAPKPRGWSGMSNDERTLFRIEFQKLHHQRDLERVKQDADRLEASR